MNIFCRIIARSGWGQEQDRVSFDMHNTTVEAIAEKLKEAMTDETLLVRVYMWNDDRRKELIDHLQDKK